MSSLITYDINFIFSVDYKPEDDEYYIKKQNNGYPASNGLQPPDIICHTERITTQPRPQSLSLK